MFAACDEFSYEGFQRPMRFELFQEGIPIVYLKLGDGAAFRAAVDTASPLMIFDRRRDGSREKTSLRMLEPVECLSNADCASTPGKPSCDIATGRCLPLTISCTSHVQCAGINPDKPKCNNGVCAKDATDCTSDTDCTSKRRPICSTGRCVLLNPRFVFHNLEHYDLPLRKVGLDQPLVLGGVVGAPLLTNFVVRLNYAATVPTLTFLDEIPDSNEELADDCDHGDLLSGAVADLAGCTAVMHTPLHGGGLATVGQYTEELGPTRLVVDVCLQPAVFNPASADPTRKPEEQLHGALVPTGVAAQAVISTGMGHTVISRSVLDRLKPLLSTLPLQIPQTLYMSGGQEQVTTIVIDRAALVSNETRLLGPCSELALRRRRLLASKVGLAQADQDLIDNNRINGAGMALLGDVSTTPSPSFTTESLTLLVVAEESDLIQGLRKELRSSAANVDMIIGGNLLRQLAMEVDYPKSRTILRCASSTLGKSCQVTPFCAHPDNTSSDGIKCPEPKR